MVERKPSRRSLSARLIKLDNEFVKFIVADPAPPSDREYIWIEYGMTTLDDEGVQICNPDIVLMHVGGRCLVVGYPGSG